MLKGFKEFILRGNVVDLAVADSEAVGMVAGAAEVAGVVSSVVSSFLQPTRLSMPTSKHVKDR